VKEAPPPLPFARSVPPPRGMLLCPTKGRKRARVPPQTLPRRCPSSSCLRPPFDAAHRTFPLTRGEREREREVSSREEGESKRDRDTQQLRRACKKECRRRRKKKGDINKYLLSPFLEEKTMPHSPVNKVECRGKERPRHWPRRRRRTTPPKPSTAT
jgi:hypothetical protein